jgi:6-phosphogluconate dehydrogenase
MGVSGGEEGALKGPSIMPGGSPGAWPDIRPIFQAIAAQVDGQPCCDWVGEGGAGHFVKMVHNGIEYGDMQLISEVYLLMRESLRMAPDDMAEVFARWNQRELESYLIEITADILRKKDADGMSLIDRILDAAGQKGTGKWTAQNALDEGVPLTLITEAVFARALSSDKEGRVQASESLQYEGTAGVAVGTDALEKALYAAKIISYTQGYLLLRTAAGTYGWSLDYGAIAMMWRGGCIIRSAFLGKIKEAFERDGQLSNLATDPFFTGELIRCQTSWRQVCAAGALSGIPLPALSSGLSYFDGLRTARGGANLLQAQRDYFGAHTYERTDRPRGEFFHTNWTGEGGDTASTAYNA